jgi:divalent metal cation (Fe/Co/Zn/Cd) transporter
MEFIREYWPQFGALMAVIVTFITMKVDISVLKEKVKTLFQIINKDK